jgi:hypothetical protein
MQRPDCTERAGAEVVESFQVARCKPPAKWRALAAIADAAVRLTGFRPDTIFSWL